MSPAIESVLLVGTADGAALRRAVHDAGLGAQSAAAAVDAHRHAAVLFHAADAAALAALLQRPDLAPAAFDTAVLVVHDLAADAATAAAETALLGLGVQAVIAPPDHASLPRALCHAVLRKRAELAARHAYATDLATGLPHREQLVEHLSQLLALREREPAAMVLMVLRLRGLEAVAGTLGMEAANVLRRKVAVRLRAGLRASDVVAALAGDVFGVLLGRLQSPADGERVAAKLLRALQQPVTIAGQSCRVRATLGLALYPEHGRDSETLLHHATAEAGASVARDAGGAANDPA